MVTKIATVQTFEEAVNVVARCWDSEGRPKIIRLEGFDGVGKSGLATLLTARLGAAHVKGDDYIAIKDQNLPYPKCLDISRFESAIVQATEDNETIVLDAVCLEEVAPSKKWGRGLIVYIKRLSFNNQQAPMWHAGFNLEDNLPGHEIARSVMSYHKVEKPHETADLVIELPECGHKFSNTTFDRSHCFDPPGAKSFLEG